MKKLFTLLLLTLAAGTLNAQDDKYEVSPFETRDTWLISLPKAELYPMEDYELRRIQNSQQRRAVTISGKAKKFRKPQTLQVVAYTNQKRSLHFDTYVVSLGGKYYYVAPSQIENNAPIENINRRLDNIQQTLSDSLALIEKQIDHTNATRNALLDSLRTAYNDSLKYYSAQAALLKAQIDSTEVAAVEAYKQQQTASYQTWQKSLPQSTRNALARLKIDEAALYSPNSAGGCDYHFVYTNLSNKTVKYLYWNGDIYNAVDDLVYCEIRNYCTFTGKDTGPVAPNEQGGGRWDCITYNYSADYVILNSVRIEYTDGSTYTIGKADLKRMLSEPSQEMDWWTKQDIQDKATKQLRQEHKAASQNVDTWAVNLNRIPSGQLYYYNNHKLHDEEDNTLFHNLSKELTDLNDRKKSVQAAYEQFQRDNTNYSYFGW